MRLIEIEMAGVLVQRDLAASFGFPLEMVEVGILRVASR
jgi:hypothetical protein